MEQRFGVARIYVEPRGATPASAAASSAPRRASPRIFRAATARGSRASTSRQVAAARPGCLRSPIRRTRARRAGRCGAAPAASARLTSVRASVDAIARREPVVLPSTASLESPWLSVEVRVWRRESVPASTPEFTPRGINRRGEIALWQTDTFSARPSRPAAFA